MSGRFALAGLLAASAMAAPHQVKRAAVTTTVVDVTVETKYVTPGSAPAVQAPAAPAAPAPAPAVHVAANPAPAAPAVNVQASTASTSKDSGDVEAAVKGGKRGLLFDSTGVLAPFTAFLGQGHFSWAANWVSSPHGTLPTGLEFVPQFKSQFSSVWNTEASAALATGSKFLMGRNEPDIESQDFISPEGAAAEWKSVMEPFASKAKLVSPAPSNSEDAGKGADWLTAFLGACSDCTIHACGFHWHASADFAYFQQSIESAHAACPNKPLWINEFSADDTVENQAAFLKQAIPYLEGLDYVERYAYFMASNLEDGGALNAAGQMYATIA